MENNQTKTKKRIWINGVIVFVILLTLFTIVGSLNDFNEIFSIVKTMDTGLIWIALALSFFSFIFLAISNHIVLRALNKEISLTDGFLIQSIETFFNGITPFSSGAQPFQLYYYHKMGVPSNEATSVLAVNFIIFQSTSVFLTTFGLIIYFQEILNVMGSNIIYILIGYTINTTILVGLFLLAYVKSAYELFEALFIFFERFKWTKKGAYKLRMKTENYVGKFQGGVKFLFTKKRVFILSSLTKLISLILLYSTTVIIFRALSQTTSTSTAFYMFFSGIMAVTTMMFVPLPGASGGTELFFSLLLAGVGLLSVQIVTVMLIWRIVTYYLGMLFGFIGFLLLKTRRTKQ